MYKLKALTKKLESKELNIIDESIFIECTINSLVNINIYSDGLYAIINTFDQILW